MLVCMSPDIIQIRSIARDRFHQVSTFVGTLWINPKTSEQALHDALERRVDGQMKCEEDVPTVCRKVCFSNVREQTHHHSHKPS